MSLSHITTRYSDVLLELCYDNDVSKEPYFKPKQRHLNNSNVSSTQGCQMAQMLKIDNFEAGFKAARYRNALFFSQPFANPIDVYSI